MFGTRAGGHLTVAGVCALALGGLATYFRLLVGSSSLVASAMVFGLCVASVVAGVAIGSKGRPNRTAYW